MPDIQGALNWYFDVIWTYKNLIWFCLLNSILNNKIHAKFCYLFVTKLLFNSWNTIQMWGGDICAFVSVGSRRSAFDTPFSQAWNYFVYAWTFNAINEIGKQIIESRGNNKNKKTVLWKFMTWHYYCEKQVTVRDIVT